VLLHRNFGLLDRFLLVSALALFASASYLHIVVLANASALAIFTV
jgi:hypothetical protein